MSATHHSLAYHPSTPLNTHALRKSTTAATTTTRVPRPASKNLGRSKLPHKGTKAKSVPAPEEDDSMGSSFLQFWYVLPTLFTSIRHKNPQPPLLTSSPIAPCVKSRLLFQTTRSSTVPRSMGTLLVHAFVCDYKLT